MTKKASILYSPKKTLTIWLPAVDKTGLPGKFRVWIYQNGVLRTIADRLEEARKKQKCTQGSGPCFVSFLRSGEEGKTRREERGILPTASDWKMKADIDRMAHFSRHIISIVLRPDILMWCDNTRQVAMIQLTVLYGRGD